MFRTYDVCGQVGDGQGSVVCRLGAGVDTCAGRLREKVGARVQGSKQPLQVRRLRLPAGVLPVRQHAARHSDGGGQFVLEQATAASQLVEEGTVGSSPMAE